MEGAQFHVYRGGDPPVAGLLRERATELTKRWLVALLEQRELDRAAATISGGILDDGPRLCAAIVGLITGGGEPGQDPVIAGVALSELVDARDPEELSAAIEALRSVIWRALREEPAGEAGQPVWELGDRLARVLESLRARALAAYAISAPATAPPAGPATPTSDAGPHPEETTEGAPRAQGPFEADPGAPGVQGPFEADREVPGAEKPSEADREVPGAEKPFDADLEETIDADLEETIDAALEDALALARARGVPLSVLCVELESHERLPFPARPARPLSPDVGDAGLEETLEASLPPEHEIIAESDHRAWVIATAWGRARSYDLALRILDVAAGGGPLNSVSVSVGVAVMGEDGEDAETLIAAAEEARFAAAASGISVLPPERSPRGPDLRGVDPRAP